MDSIMLEIEGMPEKEFKRGEVILQEGQTGTKVYILKEGAVSIQLSGNEICKVNTPGTIFGEISALLEGDYSATVVAEINTTFFAIEDLSTLMSDNHKACLIIARILALRLVNMNHIFPEIKHELQNMPGDSTVSQTNNKLINLMVKMDEFWGRSIFHPFGKKKV